MRLRPLTQRIAGDERPKQFCPILGGETLLDQTRRRTGLAIPSDRTLVVLTRAHASFYGPLLDTIHASCAVIQPENRGTAPAIFYALLRLAATAPEAPVAIFPSDHYISNDGTFMAHVDAAFTAVCGRPDPVVLLGVAPDGPEVQYGWIEPAGPITAEPGTLSRVRSFWENPPGSMPACSTRRDACETAS